MTTAVARQFFFDATTPAEGKESKDIAEALEDLKRFTRTSVQGWLPQIESALGEIQAECSVADWNGDEAEAISKTVLERAHRVTELLYRFVPLNTPAPSLTPERDGEISLTWRQAADRIFSISVGNHTIINYAGRLGRGVEPHDAVSFDSTDPTTLRPLASFISRVYR